MLDVPTLLFALMLTDVVLAASLWVALGRGDRQGVGAWTISLLLLLDIDHFKRINDTHGHQTGDAVLEGFVGIVRGCLRRTDLLARYGGEEFCVVLPGETKEGARVLAERIRVAIETSAIVVEGRTVHVTASAGIASLADLASRDRRDRRDERDGRDERDVDAIETPEAGLFAIVGRADEALYEAKRTGRNRVVVAQAA